MADLTQKRFGLMSVCIVLGLQACFTDSKLSDCTTICSAKDPNLNECFKKSAMKMIGNMANGIPELGLRALEPVTMRPALLQQPQIGIILNITDVAIYHLSKAVVVDARVEPENYIFYLNLQIPEEFIIGLYSIKGRIFIMPIHGNGQINVTLQDVNSTIQFSGNPEIRNGDLYMKVTKVAVSLETKNGTIILDNLFNGNKMLGSVMHKVMNNSWQEMYVLLKPKLEELCEKELFKLLKNFFSLVPYTELFTDFDG